MSLKTFLSNGWSKVARYIAGDRSANSKKLAGLQQIDGRLQTAFNNLLLLEQALTHKSFANENPKLKRGDNERLELLGDAVLDLVITERLMREFPDHAEGNLSRLRSTMVSERALANMARQFQIGAHICLGRGEMQSNGASKPSLLANTYEAILGAFFLDSGFERASHVINQHFEGMVQEAIKGNIHIDHKTELQEWVQSRYQAAPKYLLLSEQGPDHKKIFEVAIRIRDVTYGSGTGANKKEAEQEAARIALEHLRGGKPGGNLSS